MLKNKIVLILLMFALATPMAARAEIFSEPLENPAQEKVMPVPVDTEPAPSEQTLLEEINKDPNSYTFKQPVSKKKIAKKFLLAMAGVGISSLILFLILSLYNKLRESFKSGVIQTSKNNETSLETPDNLTDAVRTFLDKTKWE